MFDGVKMGAKVTLNGVELGWAVDQYVRYEFPIKASGATLTSGDNANVLTVEFNSSTNVAGRFMACTGTAAMLTLPTAVRCCFTRDAAYGLMTHRWLGLGPIFQHNPGTLLLSTVVETEQSCPESRHVFVGALCSRCSPVLAVSPAPSPRAYGSPCTW